jgi:hypothetical protein
MTLALIAAALAVLAGIGWALSAALQWWVTQWNGSR